jgi:hypothetical protein
MTDNTIAFDGGPNDDTTYGFVFQPVYAIANESRFKWNRWRSPLSNQNRYVRPSDHIKTVSVSWMS